MNYILLKSEIDDKIDYIVQTDKTSAEIEDIVKKANDKYADILDDNIDANFDTVLHEMMPDGTTLISIFDEIYC